jgi:hypothetical protein
MAHYDLRSTPGLGALAFREPGQSVYTVANFFARQAQLIKFLQMEPKLRAGTKPVAKPQRRIGGDRSLTVNDASDSIHWDFDLPRQFGQLLLSESLQFWRFLHFYTSRRWS